MPKNTYQILKTVVNALTKAQRSINIYLGPKPVSLSKKTILAYNKTRQGYKFKQLCHAPFVGLYFGYEGKIGVCCYNRTHILGTYPLASIKSVWDGTSLTDLRNKIKNYDLSSGCYCCQVQWVEKAYQTILAKNYDGYAIDRKYPKIFEFELSNRCNLQCIMCSEENSSAIDREKSGLPEKLYPYDDNFIEELEAFIPHLESAKFLGGEPFLIPIYYKIWDLFTRLNNKCELVVQTNGTILNNRIKELLLKSNFSLSISIDSLEKKTYETIRLNANFESTYANLIFFIDFCKKHDRFIGIACCFMQQNWKEIPQLIKFCNKHQIPITFNRVWDPPFCSVWESSLSLTDEILNFYKQQKFPQKTYFEKNNLLAFNDLINLLQQWKKQEQHKQEKEFDFIKTPVSKLESLVFEHVLLYENKNAISEDDKNLIIKKMNLVFAKFRESDDYKVILIKMIKIPGEILQKELLNNSLEKLEQLTKDLLNTK